MEKGNTVLLDQSPDIFMLIETIKVGIEIYPFKYIDSVYTTFAPFDKLSNKTIYDLYSEELNKTPYLKLLAKKHTNEYKLICLKEVWNHGKPENSFLFQIRSNTDCTTVIWENVNVGRATFVFKFRVHNSKNDIDKIKEFITSNVVTNKRSALRKAIRSGMAFKEWGCLKFIEHRTIEQFENDVLKVLISKLP